jgi:hypothetical protein
MTSISPAEPRLSGLAPVLGGLEQVAADTVEEQAHVCQS